MIPVRKSYILLLIIFVTLFSFASHVAAATLSLLPAQTTVVVGDTVLVTIVTNTAGTFINNAEATLQFPTDTLDVVSVSRSSSIFPLWVEEPSFSAGTISFNGGVANPGYNGTNGTIITIVFRAKKAGTAALSFSDAAVRANDGLGTDVLTQKGSSTITIEPAQAPLPPPPPVKSSIPDRPIITSATNPNQDQWYASSTASFNWNIPSSTITSIQASLDQSAKVLPTGTYDNSVTQKTINNLHDGTYYFHLRFANAQGWSPVAQYKINIDTTPPEPFTPTIQTVNNQNILTLNAKDVLSGIAYYMLRIDDALPMRVGLDTLSNNQYTLPLLNQGTHTIVASAYDAAGNHTDASVTFTSVAIVPPTLSLSSNDITKGDSVIVSGKSLYPHVGVDIALTADGKEIDHLPQTTAADGSFSLPLDNVKTTGIIALSARIVVSDTVHSNPSTPVYLTVHTPKITKVTIAVFWIALCLIIVVLLLILLYIGWHKFFGLRKKIEKELQAIATDTHTATTLLKEELLVQLAALEKSSADRKLTKKQEVITAKLQKNIDRIDAFIEKKLKKLL
ncbi:MAG TPA: cohesin domain-containing protein [Candidatus Paceibacterota bacterium]|nr:cohesin domain-containing protein [Candidatus Paceibacterota bacterium]